MIVTFVILKVMQLVVRVKPTEEEMATLDMSIHGEVAYKIDAGEMSPRAAAEGGLRAAALPDAKGASQ
jgi:hypothetical protein